MSGFKGLKASPKSKVIFHLLNLMMETIYSAFLELVILKQAGKLLT